MSCVPLRHWSILVASLAAAVSVSCTALPIGARSRANEVRPPSILLAYPESGGVLPADKPLLVFRFAPSDGDDPIDPAAFRAAVDGADRTSRFRVTATEAWGQLIDSSAVPGLTPGPHQVAGRVCSVRGVCASVAARVEVRAWEQTLPSPR